METKRVKRLIKVLMIALAVGSIAGQTPPYTISLSQQPLPIPANISASYSGASGQTSYWYWVIANYGVGNSQPSTPVVVNATNSTGSVTVVWSAPASPTSYTLTYDVLRTTSATFPANGSCVSCLVVGTTSALTVTDTLGALVNYSLATYNSQNSPLVLSIDNINAYAILFGGVVNGQAIISKQSYIGTVVLDSTPSGNTQTGVLKMLPSTPNSAVTLRLMPSGTGNSSSIAVYNKSGDVLADNASLFIAITNSTASMILTKRGSGTMPSQLVVGSSGDSLGELLTIPFQFNSVTKASISKLGFVLGVTLGTAVTTVATLPACPSVNVEGSIAAVSDLLGPTYLAAAVGGGAVHGGVYCNGTQWVVK